MLAAGDQLNPMLEVAQKLISSHMNDNYSFDLLEKVYQSVSAPIMVQFNGNVFMLLLTRLLQA